MSIIEPSKTKRVTRIRGRGTMNTVLIEKYNKKCLQFAIDENVVTAVYQGKRTYVVKYKVCTLVTFKRNIDTKHTNS